MAKFDNCLKIWWLVAVPLLLGGLFYEFLRPGSFHFLEQWLSIPTTSDQFAFFKKTVFFGSLPSGLWSFSLSSALLLIWEKNGRQAVVLAGSVGALVAVLFEVLQWGKLMPGQSDGWDVVFSLLFCLLALLIFLKRTP